LSSLHLLVRWLGLTGLLVAVVGVILLHVHNHLIDADDVLRNPLTVIQEGLKAEGVEAVAVYLFLAGAGAMLLWLLVEAAVAVRLTAARRSATRANAVLQAAIAVVLLVGLNVFSFFHYERIDCTRPDDRGEKRFTLAPELSQQLRQLRGETSIVVLQKVPHTEDTDLEAYQKAAAAVVVEKVRDLADLLRDFSGARFEVVLLDTTEKEFGRKVARATKNRPKLAQAIRSAPGSSIIFYASEGNDPQSRTHVHRFSFDEFLQLNQQASRQANDGNGNLVLINKGVEPLLRSILNLEEKRPRVGLLVVHEVFTSDSSEESLGLAGLKKTLIQNGFDVENIIAKRDLEPDDERNTWTWTPGADTLTDSKLLSLQSVEESFPAAERFLKGQKQGWTERRRQIERTRPDGERVTEKDKEEALAQADQQIAAYQKQLDQLAKRKGEVAKDLKSIDSDLVRQMQRTTDIQGKLSRILADCDLLLIPRLSMNANGRSFFDSQGLFRLDDVHTNAIKEFLKQGKPVFATLGSVVNPRGDPDGLEQLLAELHIRLSKKTVVYNVQQEEFARQRVSRFAAGSGEVPPLDLETPSRLLVAASATEPLALHENPLRLSLARARQARGPELDIRLRFPRPVFYDADKGERINRYRDALTLLAETPIASWAALSPHPLDPKKRAPLKTAPEFLWTVPECWIDARPLPTRDRPEPQYEESKKDDPTKGTLDETRTGPFPVGVAIEATIPKKWYGTENPPAKTARVAVIGSGAVFVDPELPPARQELLVETCNWLLDRDAPVKPASTWSYPRLALASQEKDLWLWGGRLGLPLVFLYLGVIVLLVRRAR
jgi:hypothetical protein